MKLMIEACLRQLYIEKLVAFLKSITILFADIEVNLQSRFLDRSSIRSSKVERIICLEKLFIGRFAK